MAFFKKFVIYNGKKNENELMEFEELFFLYLKEHKRNDGNPLRESTKKKYLGVYNHLKNYAKYHNTRLEIERINKDFLQDYREYSYPAV